MKIEHANITVSDIDRAIVFLQLAIPELVIRGQGPRKFGGRWLHLGTEDSYIALQEESKTQVSNQRKYVDVGVNHLGFVVEDISALKHRLSAAGYASSDAGVTAAGRTSVYFFDNDGFEWEFVEYHSNALDIRNDYQ